MHLHCWVNLSNFVTRISSLHKIINFPRNYVLAFPMHYIRYEAHYITFSTLLALSPNTNIFLCRDRFFPHVPLISINLLRSTVKSNGGTDVYIEFNYLLQNVFIRNKVCHKIRYLYSAVLQNWKYVEFLHLLACLYTTQHIYHYKSGTHIPVVCLTL